MPDWLVSVYSPQTSEMRSAVVQAKDEAAAVAKVARRRVMAEWTASGLLLRWQVTEVDGLA